MTASDVANWIMAAGTIGAVAVASVEYAHYARVRSSDAAAQIDAVAVQWQPIESPNHADPDGTAIWKYEVVASNPGTRPVRDVRISVRFPVLVRRLHYDRGLGSPTQTLVLSQQIILGGSSRRWTRTVVVHYDQREHMRELSVDITFTTPDGERRTNHMDGSAPTVVSPGAPRRWNRRR